MRLSFRLIVAVTLYCVIGAVIMRVKRGAEGPELIPHRNFWLEILTLVKVSMPVVLHSILIVFAISGGVSIHSITNKEVV